MRKYHFFSPVIALVLFLSACKTAYQPASVQYNDYRINTARTSDSVISSFLKPYADSVNKSMSGIVATAGMSLEKKQPEGTLGNVLADAELIMAREKYNTSVDMSFVNYGGIRLPVIAQGPITKGKIFELAPFDNIVVLLKLNGTILQQLLDAIAVRGGWPCSGLSFQISNKKAINVTIGGKAFNPADTYTVALVDYLANGGDELDMLRPIPQQNNGYLFRDAVIDYFTRLNKEGKQIIATIENRVSNAK